MNATQPVEPRSQASIVSELFREHLKSCTDCREELDWLAVNPNRPIWLCHDAQMILLQIFNG